MGKMNSLKIFLLLISLPRTDSSTTDDIIESCLFKILKKYFRHKPVLLITDPTAHQPPLRSLLPNLEREYHQHIIGRIMNTTKWTLQIYNTNKYTPETSNPDRLNNSLLFLQGHTIASKELFEREMEKLHTNPRWKPTGRTLIIVKSNTTPTDSPELARRVIDRLWTKSKSVDNLVMVAETTGSVRFYTWFPYKQPDCSKVRRVVQLNTFRNGRFLRKTHLFPEKMAADLEGCELIAATDACEPYVFADENDETRFVDGLEFNIITSLSHVLNFKLTTTTPKNIWTTSINNTLTGAFKLLAEHRVDMAFSCLMLNSERYLLALALPSYFEDSLVWFVPSPTYQSHAVDIFYAFPAYFWLLMILVMASALLIVLLLVYAEHRETRAGETILRLIGVSLYAPVGVPTRKSNLRVLVFVFFLYSLHITVAFQSSLFALYRQPQYDQIYTSLREAVEDGLFVYLRGNSPDLYNQSDHDLWEEILQPDRHDYLSDFMGVFDRIADEKSAVALFIKTTGMYMVSLHFTDDYGMPKVLWLNDIFSPYPVTTYLSPGNPLYDLFGTRILRVVASGLVAIWQSRAISRTLTWEGGAFLNRPLSLAHMAGAFFLLLLLLSLAGVVFLGEVLVYRVSRKVERRKPGHRRFYKPEVRRVKGGRGLL